MAALGWDQGQVYSTASVPGQTQVNSHSEITSLFYGFIQNYRLNNNFIYRYKNDGFPFFCK
jgi:DNA replication licensing factor MCM5